VLGTKEWITSYNKTLQALVCINALSRLSKQWYILYFLTICVCAFKVKLFIHFMTECLKKKNNRKNAEGKYVELC